MNIERRLYAITYRSCANNHDAGFFNQGGYCLLTFWA